MTSNLCALTLHIFSLCAQYKQEQVYTASTGLLDQSPISHCTTVHVHCKCKLHTDLDIACDLCASLHVHHTFSWYLYMYRVGKISIIAFQLIVAIHTTEVFPKMVHKVLSHNS